MNITGGTGKEEGWICWENEEQGSPRPQTGRREEGDNRSKTRRGSAQGGGVSSRVPYQGASNQEISRNLLRISIQRLASSVCVQQICKCCCVYVSCGFIVYYKVWFLCGVDFYIFWRRRRKHWLSVSSDVVYLYNLFLPSSLYSINVALPNGKLHTNNIHGRYTELKCREELINLKWTNAFISRLFRNKRIIRSHTTK